MKKDVFLISIFLLSGFFTLLYSVNLSEGFEGTTFPPAGWSVINGGDSDTWLRSNTFCRTGSYSAAINFTTSAHDDWLITPKLSPTSASHTYSFWAANHSTDYPDAFNVVLSTTGKEVSNFTVTLGSNLVPGTLFEHYSFDLNAYVGQSVYIAIQAISTDEWILFIDDVSGPPLYIEGEPSNHVTNFSASQSGSDSIILTWTGSTGVQIPGNYLILGKKDTGSYAGVADGIPVPDDTGWSDLNVSKNVQHSSGTNTYTFTGVSIGSLYTFVIYPYTNYGSIIDYKTSTPIPSASITVVRENLSEGFEGTTFPPIGWTVYNGGDGNTWERVEDYSHTGNGSATIRYDSSVAHDDWLITPKLAPTAASHTFSFWARNRSSNYSDRFNVKLSTTTNQTSAFTVTLASSIAPGNTYTLYSYDLSDYTGQNVYLAFQAISTNMLYLHIDDVSGPPETIEPEPTNYPTNFTSPSHGTDSITLTWTGSEGTQLPIQYLILAKKGSGSYAAVTDGIPVADDSNWSNNNAAVNVSHTAGTNTYTFTGISTSTAYDFRIYPYTNYGILINYKNDGAVPTVSVTTDSYAITSFPYLQNFEADWQGDPPAPTHWSQIVVRGEDPWNRNGTGYNSNGDALAVAANSGEYLLITPAMNFGTRNYRLKFWLKGGSNGGSGLRVQISDNNTDPWSFTSLAQYWNGSTMPTVWTQITLDLSAYEGIKYLGFRNYDNSGFPYQVDDVLIEEIPPNPAVCVSPANAANAVIVSSSLNWSDGGGFTNGYKLNFGTDGNGTTPPTSVANNLDMGTNLTYSLTAHMAFNTTYYWQVIPYNSGGNASNCPIWSFTTHSAPDGIPGNALDFDGSNDYVAGTGISPSLTAFTIETWVNHNSLNGTVQRYITLQPEMAVLRYDGTIYGEYNSLHFYIKKASGSLYGFRADSVLVTGEWMHIAGTYDGTNLKLYVNGLLVKSAVTTGGLYPPSGNYTFSSSGETFNGKMDEMRIWNYARSQAQIRENMHLSLTGMETGLLNYWQFNESTGTNVLDVISNCNGTMNNMTNEDWLGSTVPFGSGVSNTQTETAGVVTFTNTNLSMNYTIHNSASITVNKINTSPNIIPTGMDEVFDNQYWVVHRYGTGSFNGTMTLTVSEDLTADDQAHPNQIRLYSRQRNTDGNWNVIKTATSVNEALNQATFSGISECSQFLVCRNYPAISNLNGTALSFDGVNDYVNLGNSSSFNTGDYITIEAWIKPNSLAGRSGIFSTRLNNQAGSFQLEVGIGSGGTGRVAVSGVGRWFAQTGDNAISTGEWVHIAYTRAGVGPGSGGGIQHIYINGVSQIMSDDNSFSFVSNTSDKVIGSGTSGGQLFNGAMDEIRVWNVARTEDQIRQNMYIPLTGTETGLISYWQCNEASGTILNDYVRLINGTMMNMGNDSWTTSVFPFSSGVSNSQYEATGTVDFTGTGLSSFFTSTTWGRFTVSKLSNGPNVVPTGIDTVFNNQYWVVNRYGSGSFSANQTCTINEDIYPSEESNPGNIKLYTRSSTSSGGWTLLASASSVNAADNQVTFDSISTVGQFILVRQNPLSVDIPQNITLELEGSNPKLSWDTVSGATSYKIFSCNSPNGTFVEATSSGTFSRNIDKGMKSRATWISSTVGIDRMFYKVKAVR